MFAHISELMFDAPPAEETTTTRTATTTTTDNGSNRHRGSLTSANGQVEESMEEIALEVTTEGVIEPPPPGGVASYATDEGSTAASLSVASSGAVRVDDEAKPKRKFSLWRSSKKKETADDISEISDGESFNSAAPAAAVTNGRSARDQENDGDSAAAVNSSGFVKVDSAAPLPEKAPVSTYQYKPERKKKTWLLFVAAFLLLVAIVVPVAVVVPRNKRDSSESAASGPSPTAAPTVTTLPEQCEPVYDSLDNCLLTEVSQEQADACIDCVWSFLPENTGPCEALEAEVCNILSQCDCLTCTDELEDYLDCQSDCEIGCGF